MVSVNPKIGVHTRLTDEVEPWKVQRTWEMVREMGASWAVEYFLWAAHEPARGVYDWAHADLVVDHATNQGVKLIAAAGLRARVGAAAEVITAAAHRGALR